MGTVSKNRGMSCVGVRKTGTTLIRVSTVMGTLYFPVEILCRNTELEEYENRCRKYPAVTCIISLVRYMYQLVSCYKHNEINVTVHSVHSNK